eukprot:3677707-Alexandrium_andersonii.AAC.1
MSVVAVRALFLVSSSPLSVGALRRPRVDSMSSSSLAAGTASSESPSAAWRAAIGAAMLSGGWPDAGQTNFEELRASTSARAWL